MQFRYESSQSKNNYPNFSDYDLELTARNIFSDYKSVSQLGI
jgi:hypothetical protein